MHTLQSEPIVFDDSLECHETVTATYVDTVKLLKENTCEELYVRIINHVASVANQYLDFKKTTNKKFEPFFQMTIERPVKTFDNTGKIEIVCFVGIYCADKNDIAADETEGGALVEVVDSFALVLDPDTRRIMNIFGAEHQAHPATNNAVS